MVRFITDARYSRGDAFAIAMTVHLMLLGKIGAAIVTAFVCAAALTIIGYFKEPSHDDD